MKVKNPDIRLIILDVRSAHNVGSLFRTAEGAGVSEIYLVGYTPLPTDRFGRGRKDITKASLGAEAIIPWEHHENIVPLLKKLKKEGFEIISLEQAKEAIDYCAFTPKQDRIALIVGNEVEGIPWAVTKKSDSVIEIPMRGKKESLNVSVSGGIALYRLSTILYTKPVSPRHQQPKPTRNERQR
jgi:tRNA G18 (ribose-2'-O)-methylase SpoU